MEQADEVRRRADLCDRGFEPAPAVRSVAPQRRCRGCIHLPLLSHSLDAAMRTRVTVRHTGAIDSAVYQCMEDPPPVAIAPGHSSPGLARRCALSHQLALV